MAIAKAMAHSERKPRSKDNLTTRRLGYAAHVLRRRAAAVDLLAARTRQAVGAATVSIAESRGSDHGDLADRILDAAQRLLFRTGARKLSLSDVASLAGVSRPTIYRYFTSKEDLIDAMGKRERRRFTTAMDEAMSRSRRRRPIGSRDRRRRDLRRGSAAGAPTRPRAELCARPNGRGTTNARRRAGEGFAALRSRGRPGRSNGSPRPCRRDRADRVEPLHISRDRPRRSSPADPCRRRSFRPRVIAGAQMAVRSHPWNSSVLHNCAAFAPHTD